ncbi:MAG: GEVED domain-containing protein [Flavobacteriales bacterium]
MKRILTMFLLGMIFSSYAQENILIIGSSPFQEFNNDVKLTLEASGQFSNVDIFNVENSNPSRDDLEGYNAILIFPYFPFYQSDTLGNRLYSYIQNGGGVVEMCLSGGLTPLGPQDIQGLYSELDLFKNGTYQESDGFDTYVNDDSSHPILNEVDSINFGDYSVKFIDGEIPPGTEIVANYDNSNIPLVVAKSDVGLNQSRLVYLNFFPISSNIGSTLWQQNTDGDKLMVNALKWVAKSDNAVSLPTCDSKAKRNNFEWIESIKVGDLSFSSGKNENAYGDYTETPLVIQPAEVLEVELTPGYKNRNYTEYWRIWIDINNDGDYSDEGEMVFEAKGKGMVEGEIPFPDGLVSPNVRVKVAMSWKNYPPYCGSFNSGEVEEYIIQLENVLQP